MSDLEIIDKIKAGDHSSFRLLVDKYQALVFRTAVGFVHVKEDAEDLTQEVFIKIFQSLNTFKGEAEFTTWLYRVSVNTCINHTNRANRFDLLEFTENIFQNMFDKIDNEKNPEQKLIEKEREAKIRKAVDSLPDKQRTVFVLSKYDDLSQREIAGIMKITEGAVEQHLQRAKINLQKKLKKIVGN
ncbi:MAG: RNA polymerase sigma factor [Paludibacter sp.]